MKFLYMQKMYSSLKKYTYEIKKSPISYCKCLILYNTFFSDIKVDFENRNVQTETKEISSFDELLDIQQNNGIHFCSFKGKINEDEVKVNVNFVWYKIDVICSNDFSLECIEKMFNFGE